MFLEKGARILEFGPAVRFGSALLESMLPCETGRHGDALVLQSGRVVVLELGAGASAGRRKIQELGARK